MIQTIIIDWLKGKQNYISYKMDTDDFFQFEDKLAKVYGHGRVHYSDLEANECYIIEKFPDKPESTKHYRHNFENFNIPRIEYVYDKIKMLDNAKNLSTDWSVKNKYMGLDLLNQLRHSYESHNKFIEKYQQFTYKDIFYNIKKSDIFQIENDVLYQSNGGNFKEFVKMYEDGIKSGSKNIQEIGIFFPFKIDHDIFKHKHFLFEINPVKFLRNDKNFLTIVENFYRGYGINSNISKGLLSLEQYFIHPGLRYLEQFAYFDPLKNYQKYMKDYKQISNTKTIKKLGLKNFVFELFEILNQAQISFVKFQHENLINAIFISEGGRQKSIRDLIKSEIKIIEEKRLYERSSCDYEHYTVLLALLNGQQINKAFTAKTKVNNVEIFNNAPETIKQYAQFILDNYCSITNKGNSAKLQYIHNYYKNKIKIIAKKYKLNLEESRILNEMLLDLIYFYGDRSKEKLSRPFNTTIAEIYKKYQRKNLEDIIDFDFQAKFIQKYNYIFEQYRPIVLNKNLSA